MNTARIDPLIRSLGSVIAQAAPERQPECVALLADVLRGLGEVPDVAGSAPAAWSEVQRQCSLAVTALDSCRRPPTERPGRREELIADAFERAVRCVRAAHEGACGRLP